MVLKRYQPEPLSPEIVPDPIIDPQEILEHEKRVQETLEAIGSWLATQVMNTTDIEQ